MIACAVAIKKKEEILISFKYGFVASYFKDNFFDN
jgi:hypothetical protein